MLPSPLRFTQRHASSFIENITAPTCLVLANQGVMHKHPEVLARIDAFKHLTVHRVDGGHHLHLEEPAPQVAAILKDFYTSLS